MLASEADSSIKESTGKKMWAMQQHLTAYNIRFEKSLLSFHLLKTMLWEKQYSLIFTYTPSYLNSSAPPQCPPLTGLKGRVEITKSIINSLLLVVNWMRQSLFQSVKTDLVSVLLFLFLEYFRMQQESDLDLKSVCSMNSNGARKDLWRPHCCSSLSWKHNALIWQTVTCQVVVYPGGEGVFHTILWRGWIVLKSQKTHPDKATQLI